MQLGAAVIGKQKLEFKEKSETNEPYIEVITVKSRVLTHVTN